MNRARGLRAGWRVCIRWGLVGLGLLLLAAGLLLLWRVIRQEQIRAAIAIHSAAGIDSLEKVQLGGIEQSIQIRGHNRANPILLVLHGGPGVPLMPLEYVNAELEKHFTIVEWDQRGAGKSYSPTITPQSMTIPQLLADAEQLAQLLQNRFQQPKIFVLGHSTGTVIGVLLAAKHPEAVRAYVGISQVADLKESENILYAFAVRTAAKENDRKAQQELHEIGPPPFARAKQLQISQKWVNHFAPDPFGADATGRWKLLFFSPACTLGDLRRMVVGAKFSFDALWHEFFAVNLFEEVPRLDVPVFFLQGRNDHVVTAEVAAKYFETLSATRGKQFIWFDHSAHWPQLEEPEKFGKIMVEQVLSSR